MSALLSLLVDRLSREQAAVVLGNQLTDLQLNFSVLMVLFSFLQDFGFNLMVKEKDPTKPAKPTPDDHLKRGVLVPVKWTKVSILRYFH